MTNDTPESRDTADAHCTFNTRLAAQCSSNYRERDSMQTTDTSPRACAECQERRALRLPLPLACEACWDLETPPTWYTKGPDAYKRALISIVSSPNAAEFVQYSRNDPAFALWLWNVSRRLAPFSLFDLPDFPSRDWFDAGVTPAEAADELAGTQ